MKDETDKIIEKFKAHIAIANFEKENKEEEQKTGINTLKNKETWRYIVKKRVIATICASAVLVSGVVFATNIEKIKDYFRGLGEGVESAIENGYIANPEMEYLEAKGTISEETGIIVEDVNIEAKIDDFLMDDLNLSTQFSFKFDEKIKEYIDLVNIHNIELNDLIVRDEENRIIYSGNDKEAFEKYCKENNLDYIFGEFDNEKYYNNGLNWFPSYINEQERNIKLTYNMYSDGYPKSKKLNFTFSKITITEEQKEGENANKIRLQGNWNIKVEVPEKMYNRTTESYKVVSCSNDRFKVYASKVSDTGFEIGMHIENMIRPEYPKELREKQEEIWSKYEGVVDQTEANKEWNQLLIQSPYKEINDEFYKKAYPITLDGENLWLVDRGEKTSGCYVINSQGKKFTSTLAPSRKANSNYIEGNQFDFYETFGMTKYEATDKITVIIDFYGDPVKIELEKIK